MAGFSGSLGNHLLKMQSEGLYQASHDYDPDDIINDGDDDDGWEIETPPEEGRRRETAQPDPNQEVLRALAQAQTNTNERMSDLANYLHQLTNKMAQSQPTPPPQQQKPAQPQGQSAYEALFNQGGEQGQPQENQPPQSMEEVAARVTVQTLTSMRDQVIAEQRKENELAKKFAGSYPGIVQQFSKEVEVEWDRLKNVAPHLSADQRYVELEREMVRRYGNVKPKNLNIPTRASGNPDNRTDELEEDHKSAIRRIKRKNKETALSVKQRREKQRLQTSWDGTHTFD